MLFKKEINNWKSWGQVFQDREAFTPLAHAILKEAGFPPVPLGALSPGTNAVFRAGDVVIKIYVPAESGLDTFLDWQNEQTVMKEAARLESLRQSCFVPAKNRTNTSSGGSSWNTVPEKKPVTLSRK
ncbi:MAG: hypothetical protein IKM31_07675 [Oscillospiraceae bacterium]|nr:hypothetical protein [Oscillospiraceae bacterium]